MAETVNQSALHRLWVHSHEEDTDTEMVFRPGTYNFPPARGRTSFDLKPDGSLVAGGISPDDRRSATGGTWKLESNNKLAFYTGSQSTPDQVMEIVSVEPERLVARK
jgi:hypothetical protein